jgi:hypothetical protein
MLAAPYTSGESLREFAEIKNSSDTKFFDWRKK